MPVPSSSNLHSHIVRAKPWMPFGDIILRAEDTFFRVNRDILAMHSVVFRDMFEVARPVTGASLVSLSGKLEDDSEDAMVDGCTVLRVHDSAQDWALVLAIMYSPTFGVTEEALDFDTLAALLRLGRKYDMESARSNATSRILYEFPRDFDAFNSLNSDMTRIKYRPGIYADLLCLAYNCGLHSAVPLLVLCCSRAYTVSSIFFGIPRDDGSCVILSAELKSMLAISRENSLLFQHISLGWTRGDGDMPIGASTCTSPTQCAGQLLALGHIIDKDHVTREGFDLGFMIDQWDGRWTGLLCSGCEDVARALYERGRYKAWEGLPVFCGLGEWENLCDEL
ncbi:hypothetical protein C8F01DRAFT_1369795 [Mycena amicta]|nr:hypothetical protein C8F01DRAFT_1369795 [Mycena amicta]